MLLAAPMALAENGVGLMGPTTDKTVTFFCSARPTTCFSASAQTFIPSSSSCPSRLPEKQMMFLKPAALVASMASRILLRHTSWFFFLFSPGWIGWLLVIVQIRPCFLIVSKSLGPSRSMPTRPIFLPAAARVSRSILL